MVSSVPGDDTIQSAREALREKISKYLTRAEVLKGQVRREIVSVQQIHIKHNDVRLCKSIS